MRHRKVDRTQMSGENIWNLIRTSYNELSSNKIDLDAAYRNFESYVAMQSEYEPQPNRQAAPVNSKSWLVRHRGMTVVGCLTGIAVLSVLLTWIALGIPKATSTLASPSTSNQHPVKPTANGHKEPALGDTGPQTNGHDPAVNNNSTSTPPIQPSTAQEPSTGESRMVNSANGISADIRIGRIVSADVALGLPVNNSHLQATLRVSINPELPRNCGLALLAGNTPTPWRDLAGALNSRIIKVPVANSSPVIVQIDSNTSTTQNPSCTVISPPDQSLTRIQGGIQGTANAGGGNAVKSNTSGGPRPFGLSGGRGSRTWPSP
jgi:hypothetical protein